MAKSKIVVLLHRKDKSFHSLHYLIHLFMKEWQSMGFSTEVTAGAERFVAGDLLIPHIDLTVLPDEYVALFDRYPSVVNRALTDISKSRISLSLVKRDDPYDGAVIVKTDRNSGGIPERYLCSEKRFRLPDWPGFRSKAVGILERKIRGWRNIETLVEYPVFASLRDVPAGVFENPNLVVEKFQPEREGDRFRIRHYSFFAGQAVNRLSRSKAEIVKGGNLVQSEDLPAPQHDLDMVRHERGMDFGRFDYVMLNDKPTVFDLNRTPGYDPADEFFSRTSPLLASGIRSLMVS